MSEEKQERRSRNVCGGEDRCFLSIMLLPRSQLARIVSCACGGREHGFFADPHECGHTFHRDIICLRTTLCYKCMYIAYLSPRRPRADGQHLRLVSFASSLPHVNAHNSRKQSLPSLRSKAVDTQARRRWLLRRCCPSRQHSEVQSSLQRCGGRSGKMLLCERYVLRRK